MGKRRSIKRIPTRNDDKATHILRQVLPRFVVDDINEALSTNQSGSVFIARCGKDSMSDFYWRRTTVWSTSEIIAYINNCAENNFVVYINNVISGVHYEVRLKVAVTFKEKGRILGVLMPVYNSMKKGPDRSKLYAEIKRIKHGGVYLINNVAEARQNGREESNSTG